MKIKIEVDIITKKSEKQGLMEVVRFEVIHAEVPNRVDVLYIKGKKVIDRLQKEQKDLIKKVFSNFIPRDWR